MNRTLPALTGLRFFAALAVFLFHFGATWSQRHHFPDALTALLKHGFMGVSIFFILSGFILSHSYSNGLGQWRDVARFWSSRVARIYPVYLVALALAFPLLHDVSLSAAADVVLMVQSWGPARSDAGYYWIEQAWTLSVEATFYLGFPVLFAFVRRATRGYAIAGVAIASVCIVSFSIPWISPGSVEHHELRDWLLDVPLPLTRMVEFVYGMFLYQVFLAAPHRERSSVAASVAVTANLAAIALLLASPLDSHWTSLAVVFCGLLIYQLAAYRTWLSALLSSRWALTLGCASYAIYLLQGPVRAWVGVAVASESLGAAINPFFLVALSILVYRWIEEPARRAIKRAAESLISAGRTAQPPVSARHDA